MLKRGKINRHLKIACACLMALSAIFLLAKTMQAAGLDVGLQYAEGTGLGVSDPRIIIANIIRIALGFLGIIALGLIIYAGWLWMTSAGNEDKIERAKKILINAIIGLVIVLASFAIASFILNSLLGATGGGTATDISDGGGGRGLAALGSGIINSHYPARDQKDVPRNTKIVINFKEAIDPSTIITGALINKNNIKIYKTADGLSGAVTFDVAASKTDDNKTFVFKPTQYLGSPLEKDWYSVALGANIKKVNGDLAFAGVVGEIAYDWMFEVGTFIDETPPTIKSIIPRPSTTQPRNVVVQINFSEAVDPISASGASASFNNIRVIDNGPGSIIDGIFYISNQYKTVEFLTLNACGINSCGNTVYCLPADIDIKAIINAATLVAPGTPSAIFPYDGVVDMADNSFDGNGDGLAQGPVSDCDLTGLGSTPVCSSAGDNAFWVFSTNNTIDITAPTINQIEPQIGVSGVDLSAIPKATFSKLLMSSSLNSTTVTLYSSGYSPNYWISKSDTVSNTTVNINHDQFNEDTSYKVEFNSGINDIYQNCYSPCSGLGITGNPSCCEGVPSSGSTCP